MTRNLYIVEVVLIILSSWFGWQLYSLWQVEPTGSITVPALQRDSNNEDQSSIIDRSNESKSKRAYEVITKKNLFHYLRKEKNEKSSKKSTATSSN